MTGVVGMYGEEISLAARIAIDEINEHGGVLGAPAELIVLDDGSLPETAVPAAVRLVDEFGCHAIIGNLLSNSRIAVASQVAAIRRLPMLNFSFYEGSIRDPWFFHFAALPNQQIDRMIPFMLQRSGPKMFFAGNNYEWPMGSIHAAKRVLSLCGGEVVGEEYFRIGTRNFSPLLDRLARSGADVFVPYAAGHDQRSLLEQFTARGLKGRIQVVTGHFDEQLARGLDPEVSEGVFSCNTYFMSVRTDENASFLARLSQHTEVSGLWPQGDGVLTNFGEGTYVCVRALAAAAETARGLDSDALAEALRSVEVRAPQGQVRMNPKLRHASVSSFLAQGTAAGTFEILADFGSIEPSLPSRYHLEDAPMAGVPARALAPKGSPSSKRTVAMEVVLDAIDLAVLTTDARGWIVESNGYASECFGYTREELQGLHVQELIPPRFRERHHMYMTEFLRRPAGRTSIRGIYGYRKDGTEFPAEGSVFWVDDPSAGRLLSVAVRDCSHQRSNEDRLRWMATHDPLTDLPNRVLVKERLDSALARTRQGDGEVALLFLDLDNFKLVNDSLGHQVGDALLVELARRLLRVVRGGDLVGRFGGDEFMIIAEQLESGEEALWLASRLREAVTECFHVGGHEVYVSASIGVARTRQNKHHGANDMIREADTAMYAAKEQGRNRCRVFDETLQARSRSRLEIASGLRQPDLLEQLDVYYQPIVCAHHRTLHGAEALVRWRHPQRGYISPMDFIPVAESTGVIMDIGAYVMKSVLESKARWNRLFPLLESMSFSINLSTRQLSETGFPDALLCEVERAGVHPSEITLEVTETSLMSDIEFGMQALMTLGEYGFGLAVDDFGTGYSSLSYIKDLPVRTLKVDRLFARDVEQEGKSRAIYRAVVAMSQALGLFVVAEGVETEVQAQVLREIGCDALQGYHFDRPVSAADFEARIRAHLNCGKSLLVARD